MSKTREDVTGVDTTQIPRSSGKMPWNPCAAVLSVQWMVWLYGLVNLAGYRAWGWFAVPRFHTAWLIYFWAVQG